MNTTPDAHPQPVQRQRPCDDAAVLPGTARDAFPSELPAWKELNRVSFEHMRQGVAIESSCSPSAVPAADQPPSLPVPAADLEAAAARLRPDPALSKALTRLLDGGWTYQDDNELVVRFDPRSKGRGRKPPRAYTTTRDTCTCPGAIIRGGCYHPLAWQIVNEALLPTTTLQCTLPSALFVSLCRLALATGTEHVTLTADSAGGTLTLGVPNVATGALSVTMITPVLLTLVQQLRAADLTRVVEALVRVLPPEGDALVLDLSAGSLLVLAGPADAPVFLDGLDTRPIDSPAEPSA
jgi:hypothetical protein